MRRKMGGAILLAVVLTGVLYAQEGKEQWHVTLSGFPSLSSPAISADGSTIYLGLSRPEYRGGRIVAISPLGVSRWGGLGREVGAPIDASPTVAPNQGGRIYIGDTAGRFYALNPVDGKDIWTPRSVGGSITSSAALAADGTVYVNTAILAGRKGQLVAFSPDGTERWRFNTDEFAETSNADSSPAVGPDGTIYFGSPDRYLYAIYPNGQLRWRFPTGGKVQASPAIGRDGTIYFGSYDQNLYALDPNGNRKWAFLTGGRIDSSPALGADGTIYFAADRNFYALRPEDNPPERLRWKTDVSSGSISSPAVRADGVIIVGFDDLRVRAFEPADGRVRWVYDTEARDGEYIESSPLVAPDGSIYIGSLYGLLYKINGNGSPLSWTSSWPSFRGNAQRTGLARSGSADGHLVNIATRAQVTAAKPLIAGFIVQGVGDKKYLVRGVGPALVSPPFNIPGALSDPRLRIFSGTTFLQENDNWDSPENLNGAGIADTESAVGAFPLPAGSKDAALIMDLPRGAFSGLVEGADNATGVALVEVYDATRDRSGRIMNLSTRGQVGTGENILIAGFVVGGTGSVRLLLRGNGPALSKFGVSGVLAQPRLELFRGDTSLGVNIGWTTGVNKRDIEAAAASVAAFELDNGSADCAMLFEAQPGPYTVQISGLGNTTGEAMVEIYVLP